MTKRSEIAAMLAYPIIYYGELDVNRSSRIPFKEGYEQAEKDLALTWEDITTLIRLCEQVKTEWWFRDMKGIGTQKHFEEVLRRFNEQREKK